MTIQAVIDMVREKTADVGNNTIWTDANYLALANECLRYIHTKHYVFTRDLVDMDAYLQVGETKKYDLPDDFQKKEHVLFLDGIQMELIDDHDAQEGRRDNVGYSGSYWLFMGADGKLQIELREAVGTGVIKLFYYKRMDTMVLSPTPSDLLVDELEFPLQSYLQAQFWRKREFEDMYRIHMADFEAAVGKYLTTFLDKKWKMYRSEYRTVMAGHGTDGYCFNGSRIYNSSGILVLSGG